MGDATKESLSDIWQNDRYRTYREHLRPPLRPAATLLEIGDLFSLPCRRWRSAELCQPCVGLRLTSAVMG